MNALRRFIPILAWSVPAGLAAAAGTPQSATAKLAQGGEVSCQPALPYFCSNIHVGCSGRTTIGTFAFKLRADASRGWIESGQDASGIGKPYQQGRLEWAQDGTYALLRPVRGKGYIKLLADGKYSFRHYVGDAGTMSYGDCN